MLSCEFERLTRQYQFIGRQYFRDATGVTNVGIGAKVALFSNQKFIAISILQAVRIIHFGVMYLDAAESEDVTQGAGNIFVLKGAGAFPEINRYPSLAGVGTKFNNAGTVIEVEDVLIYGTDLADVGFVGGPGILLGGQIGALGGAAAHNITNTIWVMWDLYQIRPGDDLGPHFPGTP